MRNAAAMPQTRHIERHFTASDTIRDVVIGMSDGLTVPFALAAGLSGAVTTSGIIVTAGLAEIAAGAIAMGLGGYLAARSDAEHYEREKRREKQEVVEKPEAERSEVRQVFRAYGLSDEEIAPIIKAFEARPKDWINFMMRFELGLEKPDPKRAPMSAATIAGAYVAGGLIPMIPYMLLKSTHEALLISVGLTLLALFVFGYIKGSFTGLSPLRSATQTVLIGGIAAGAAFGIARLLS
jgi:VIT1/CCC1 family predicted Fe2+/Mn2+ transporter